MKKNNVFVLILLFFTAAYLVPTFTFANGGDQRLIEQGKYYINLSRAPFTPRVGVKTSFVASFFDVGANRLISEDLMVRVRISKLGDAPKGNFVFEQDTMIVKGGVLELKYTFDNPGLHEIFFDFAFASNPQRVYEVPDFLIDVQKTSEDTGKYLLGGIIGSIGSFILGWYLRKAYSDI